MTDQLPAPLVPADVDLRDFPFVQIDVARLFNSQFHARATDTEWRAGVTLWLKAAHQVPAGSLPDDDIALARLAELGRDLKTWRKIKEMALYGWIKCSDGLLYHPVVAEKALHAWGKKQAQRQRTEAARNARLQRQSQNTGQTMSQTGTASVTEPVTGSKYKGEYKGEGDSKSIGSRSSPARKGTRLPADWKPDHALLVWAENNLPDRLDVERETEKFKNHWAAASGAKGVKLDWPATWRNWMLRAAESIPGFRPPAQQPQHRSGFAALQAELKGQQSMTLEGTARHDD